MIINKRKKKIRRSHYSIVPLVIVRLGQLGCQRRARRTFPENHDVGAAFTREKSGNFVFENKYVIICKN